jgi:hypothetical protein
MSDELWASKIVQSSGLDISGGIAVLHRNLTDLDGPWFTTTEAVGTLRLGFPTPSRYASTWLDVQIFHLLLRRASGQGGGNPTISVWLKETGSDDILETLCVDQQIVHTNGEVLSLNWDATNISIDDSSKVELYMELTRGVGGQNYRNLELGAVIWTARLREIVVPDKSVAVLSLKPIVAPVTNIAIVDV